MDNNVDHSNPEILGGTSEEPVVGEASSVDDVFTGGLWVFAKTFFYFVLISGALVGIITLVTWNPYFLIMGGITCVVLGVLVGGFRMFAHWTKGGFSLVRDAENKSKSDIENAVMKKVSISLYLVLGGAAIIILELLGSDLEEIAYFGPLGVISGTIWGLVDGIRAIIHKRKSKEDPTYAEQTEPPPTCGFIAFGIGLFCIVAGAIAIVIVFIGLGVMTH